MQVIIYLRKSREDSEREKKTGEDILAVHRDRLVALCRKQKHQYIIKEEVVSGDTIAGRPVFQEVLHELIPSVQYSAVVVNDISRLGRGNMRDAGEIYQAIIDYSVKIITPHKIYNSTNRSDLRQIRFELFLSREEYEMIKDRLQDGKDAAARAGRPAHNRWLLGLDSIRGHYVLNKEGLELAEKIFGMIRDGYSLRAAARILNEMGHKTSRRCKWTAASVNKLIHNIHYEGYQTWHGEIIPAEHGPLLPLELIQQARNKVGHISIRPRNTSFWVPLYCAKCGARMYGDTARPKRKGAGGEMREYKYEIYFCSSKPKCYTQVRAHIVHEQIKTALWRIITDKSLQKDLIQDREQNNNGLISREIERLQRDVGSKEGRLEKIKQDYIDGRADIGIYNEAKETIGRQVKAMHLRLRELEPKIVKARPVKSVLTELERALKKWDYSVEDWEKATIVREYTSQIEYDGRTKETNIIPHLPM